MKKILIVLAMVFFAFWGTVPIYGPQGVEWGLSPCFAGEKEDLQARQALIQQAMLKADQEFQTQMAMREKAISDLVSAQSKMDQIKNDFMMLQGKFKEIADKLNALK